MGCLPALGHDVGIDGVEGSIYELKFFADPCDTG
jgi:hypothetical protein